MTADPTQVRSPLELEIRARRSAQALRAERARLGEIDLEIGNTCPECGPDGAGGTDAGMMAGWVPVTVEVPAGKVGVGEYREPWIQVQWQPCFSCNPDRWAAWQEGNLRGSRRPRGETAAHQQDRHSREGAPVP